MATKKKINKTAKKDDMMEYIKELEAEKKALLKANVKSEEALRKLNESSEETVTTALPLVDEESNVKEYHDKEYVEIRPDKYIQVISLCPNTLTLSTSLTGGKSFKFRALGEKKRIIYQDLNDIMEVQPTFLESGVFYIADRDVVRRHGLDDFYKNIITKEEMETVLSADDDTAFSIFKSANERQQEYLVGMLVKRIVSGEDIDRNFIYLVEQETGINISVQAAEEKSFKEILDGKDEK